MCGLVGILDKNTDINQLNMFRLMLHFDITRGEDSTGVAIRTASYQGNDGVVDSYKAVGLPQNLYRKYPEVFEDNGKIKRSSFKNNITFVMGHNRAKTVGAPTQTNAHPFRAGHIVGCHNGTIRKGLNNLPDPVEGETDSEQIFRALAEGMPLQEIVDHLSGAMALTWWNANERTFNIYRNDERPLWIAHNHSKSAYAYASEKWMLEVAAAKARLDKSFVNIEAFPANVHCKFSFNGPLKLSESINIEKKSAAADNNKVTYLPPANKPKTDKGVTFDSGWIDPKFTTQKDFDKAAGYGCALCQSSLFFEDYKLGDVKFLDKETPLCGICAEGFSKEGAA